MKQWRSEEENQKTVGKREAQEVEKDNGEQGQTLDSREGNSFWWGKNSGSKTKGKGGEKYSVARSFWLVFDLPLRL